VGDDVPRHLAEDAVSEHFPVPFRKRKSADMIADDETVATCGSQVRLGDVVEADSIHLLFDTSTLRPEEWITMRHVEYVEAEKGTLYRQHVTECGSRFVEVDNEYADSCCSSINGDVL
jgi:hypothetical protein